MWISEASLKKLVEQKVDEVYSGINQKLDERLNKIEAYTDEFFSKAKQREVAHHQESSAALGKADKKWEAHKDRIELHAAQVERYLAALEKVLANLVDDKKKRK